MKTIHIAALAASTLILSACNRSTDQGGTSQAPVTDTRRDSGDQSRTTPPSSVNPPAPAQDADVNAGRTPRGTTDEALTKPADNTGKNVRDRSDAAVTPGDQSEAKPDLDLTRRIRRALTENNQFSTTAKNIKIVTANGKVTLRGPVNSTAERDQIAQLVQGTTGVTAVDNELEVKTNP